MKLFFGAQLSQLTPHQQSEFEIELDSPIPFIRLLDDYNVPVDMVHLLIINGKIAKPDQAIVEDQDHVIVYPYVTGG